MIEFLQVVLAVTALLGAVATALSRDPFDKLISLGVMIGGIMPFIVDRGYLDVAVAVALLAPITTIFVLALAWRRDENGA
jgi:energy-converting hydrogenase A subunit D